MRKINLSIFMKYLISYVIVLLVPFITIYIYTKFEVLNFARLAVEESNVQKMNQVTYIIDSYFSECDKIAESMRIDRNINYEKNLEEVVWSKKFINELNQYFSTRNSLSSIAFYADDDKYIYTDSTTYRYEDYIRNELRYQNLNSEQLDYNIKNNVLCVLPADLVSFKSLNKTKNIVTYIVPEILPNKTYNTKLIFFLDFSFFDNQYNYDEERYSFAILNKQQDIIYSTKYFDGKVIKSLKLDEDTLYDDDRYIKIIDSNTSNFKYVFIEKFSRIYDGINLLEIKLVIVYLIVLVIGCVIIYFNMRKNYKPLKDIIKKIPGCIPKDKKKLQGLKELDDAIEFLTNKNKQLQKYSATQLIMNLLQGEYNTIDSFNKDGQEFGLEFSKENFCVISISLSELESISKSMLRKDIEEYINKYFTGFICNNLQRRNVFIAQLNDTELVCFDSTLQNLHSYLKEGLGMDNITMGVSTITKDINKLPYLYKESVMALDYTFIKGKDSIVLSSDINNNTHKAYPYNLIEKFQEAFNCNNPEVVYDTMNQIKTFVKDSKCPLYYARSICYDLIYIISQKLNSNCYAGNGKTLYKKYIPILSDLKNFDDLIQVVNELYKNINEYLPKLKLEKKKKLVSDINEYIKTNYCNCELSLESISQYFDIPPSSLSNYYKNITGLTIMDYVTSLRMNKAKMLLEEDNYSINQITLQIGYINSSSFIRRFKGLYGITPRQYALSKKNKK